MSDHRKTDKLCWEHFTAANDKCPLCDIDKRFTCDLCGQWHADTKLFKWDDGRGGDSALVCPRCAPKRAA